MEQKNSISWEDREIVKVYASAKELHLAEQNIFNVLRDRLSSMAMLDIGVGGGRTTMHFSPATMSYTGIDYSSPMVTACKDRFKDAMPSGGFHVCDVRQMDRFGTGSFDLVLFSYNGIGYVDHPGRLKALSEINRVLKPGGVFIFSAHNYSSMVRFLKIPGCLNPFQLYQYFKRKKEISNVLKEASGRGYAIIRDGAECFRIVTYYVKPSYQICQLQQAGFGDVRLFSEQTGRDIRDLSAVDELTAERWFYYLCYKK